MTYTYVGPTTSDRDKVRFLIQDTDMTAPLMTDEEINWLITEWADVYDAAANAADTLAGSFARKSDYQKRVGDLHLTENFSKNAERYRELGTNIRLMRQRRYNVNWIVADSSLVSVANRNVEIPTTEFWEGQFDNPRGTGSGLGTFNAI